MYNVTCWALSRHFARSFPRTIILRTLHWYNTSTISNAGRQLCPLFQEADAQPECHFRCNGMKMVHFHSGPAQLPDIIIVCVAMFFIRSSPQLTTLPRRSSYICLWRSEYLRSTFDYRCGTCSIQFKRIKATQAKVNAARSYSASAELCRPISMIAQSFYDLH